MNGKGWARWLAVGLALFWAGPALAWVPERRAEPGNEEFGWFFAPTPMQLEGVGSAVPVFGLMSNFYGPTDLIAVQTLPGGDLTVEVAIVDEFPLIDDHLQLTGGYFNEEVSFNLYERGIDSDREDYIVPFQKFHGTFYQAKLLLWEQRIQANYQSFKGQGETQKIFDPDGNVLSEEKSSDSYTQETFGLTLDLTDDPIDPRKGFTLGQVQRPSKAKEAYTSDITVIDTDLSVYLPFGKDTLVLNAFQSLSRIDRAGVTDEATARAILDQKCDPTSAVYLACKAGEEKLVADFLAYNRYGAAMPLGGPYRLRSYAFGRFTAGNSAFQGIEYRYNFSAEPTTINWYLLGGVKTLLQLAVFHEQGTVAEHRSDLDQNLKTSTGVGLRALISGFIYRLDVAHGDEGMGVTLFIDYPMLLNPVIN